MNPREKNKGLIAFGIYGSIGFQLAATVVGGLLIGNYLDHKWGTEPILALVGLLLGALGGFYNLFRILKWKDKKLS